MTTETIVATPHFVAKECWRENADGHVELVAARCAACGTLHLPRVPVCACCGEEEFQAIPLASEGTLYAYTIVRTPPPGYAGEYAVGYVDFPEGVRVFGQVKLMSEKPLNSGMPVALEKAMLFKRADGTPVVSYRFVPTSEGDQK